MLLIGALLLIPGMVFSGGFETQAGWETNPLSAGLSFRLGNEFLAFNASVQYPIVMTMVLAALEDLWLNPMFLCTASVNLSVPLSPRVSIAAGPGIWALSKGIERFVVSSYGLDIGLEFHEPDGSGLWTLGFMMPVLLQGEIVNSAPNGTAWAWDEFGFALVPSVRALWKISAQ